MLQDLTLPKLNGLSYPSQTWTISNRSSDNYRNSYHSDVDNLPATGTVTFDQNQLYDFNQVSRDDDNLMNWLLNRFQENDIKQTNKLNDPDLDTGLKQTMKVSCLSHNANQKQEDRNLRRDSTSSISSCTLSRVGRPKPEHVKIIPNEHHLYNHQPENQPEKPACHYFPRLNVMRDSSVESRSVKATPGCKSPKATHVNRLICDIRCKMSLIRKTDHKIIEQLNQAGVILSRHKLVKPKPDNQAKICGRRQLITKQKLMPSSPIEAIRTSRSRTKERNGFQSKQDLLDETNLNKNMEQEMLNGTSETQGNLATKRWSKRFIESPWGQVQHPGSKHLVQQEPNNQTYSPRIGNLIKLPKFTFEKFDSQGSDLDLTDDELVTSNFSLNTSSLRTTKKERSLSQSTLTATQERHLKPSNGGSDASLLFNRSTNLKHLSSRLKNPFRRKASTPTPMTESVLQPTIGQYRRSASLSQFQTPANTYLQKSVPNNLELESQLDDKFPFIKPKLLTFGVRSNFH